MADMAPPPALPRGRGRAMRRAPGDAGVIKTNDDAQSTKLSCASLGYFRDECLPLLAKCLPSRKSPLINRGTWARHAAMRQVTTDFAAACLAAAAAAGGSGSAAGEASGPVCQVVVLGAGSDSSWFNLAHQGWQALQGVRFVELDHHEVVSRKARAVLSSDKLVQLLPDGTTASTVPRAAEAAAAAAHAAPAATWTKQAGGAQAPAAELQEAQPPHAQQPVPSSASCCCGPAPPPAAVVSHVQELVGPRYSLVGADLRSLQQFEAALERAGFDSGQPTLYLAECVLIYLEPAESQALLAAAAARAASAGAPAAVAIYEQTRPDDAFGATMISNLEARGCPLRGVTAVPTPASQEQRLLDTGWSAAAAADMAAVYYGGASPSSHAAAGGASSSAAAAGAAAPAGSSGGWLRPAWQAERARIERLELLDELEEWRLLQEHYVLALGVLEQGAATWLADALQLQSLRELGSR